LSKKLLTHGGEQDASKGFSLIVCNLVSPLRQDRALPVKVQIQSFFDARYSTSGFFDNLAYE
jgi:hypothetical protein